MSVNISTVAQVGYHKSKRPASIPELEERAMLDLWDDSKDFEYHLKMAEKYRKEGKECARRGDLEGAFIKFTRAVTLMAEKLPMQDYKVKLNSIQRTNLFLVSISMITLNSLCLLGVGSEFKRLLPIISTI